MTPKIKGVLITDLKRHSDARGWLIELYRRDEIPKEFLPEMSYVSMTRADVTRGPHEHVEQADLFCFLGPSTFRLYLWDNRPTSSTFGACCSYEFGEASPAAVIVPPGVVHAYKNIGEVDGVVFNAPNRLFAGEDRKQKVDEIRHESDPNSQFRIDD